MATAKKEIFFFRNYKEYLENVILSAPAKGRGVRARMAEAVGCQISYLTRVFANLADLSLEQAESLSRFLNHTLPEKHFFLLLVQYARAGTIPLKRYFSIQLDELESEQLNLKNRFKERAELDAEVGSLYYETWYFSLIHILTSIPAYQTRPAIASALPVLSENDIDQALSFLVRAGLVVRKNDRFQIGVTRVHLGVESRLLKRHHQNWRMQVHQHLDLASSQKESFHYTSIVSLSEECTRQVRIMLTEFVEKFNSMVADAKEEDVRAIHLDFYRPT